MTITERLRDLVRIPSPSGDESAAIDLVAEWLAEGPAQTVDRFDAFMGDLETDPAYPGREVERDTVPVVAATAPMAGPGPTVVLTGHVDTVAVGEHGHWSHDPLGAEREGDRIYGRGACDMKAGVVAALGAFEALASHRSSLGGEVRFVAVPGEEDGGTGTLAAIRRGWSGDHAIITEPTSSSAGPQVVVAHGGALTITIEVTGRGAHGSVPHEGESALDHFITVYRAMREIEHEVNDAVTHPAMRALSMPHATTVGIVRGGWWASNVMESLTAVARIGVPVGRSAATTERAYIDSLLDKIAADPWLAAHPPRIARTGAAFGSSSIEPDHPLVTAVQDAAEATTGRRPGTIGVPYGCDMALWRDVGGAAAVIYGPGDVALAHAADEWVSVAETEAVAETLVQAVRLLLGP